MDGEAWGRTRSPAASTRRAGHAARRIVGLTLAAAALALPHRLAAAEPWSDEDGVPLRERTPLGPLGIELGAELRAEATHVDELDLTGTELTTFEQRLRAEAALDDGDRLRLVVSVDALDGVPWGAARTEPGPRLEGPRAGIGFLDVDYRGPDAADDPRAWGLALGPAPAATWRSAFGEAWLPFGRLRFGRQPAVRGSTLLGADGDGRRNRFGVDHGGDRVDRVELLVRPLVPLGAPPDEEERGLGVTVAYDRLEASASGAGVRQRAGATVRLLAPLPTVEQVFDVGATARVLWGGDGDAVGSELEGLVMIRARELSLGFDGVLEQGESERAARSLAPLLGVPVRAARVRRWGSRSVLRWDSTRVTAYVELDTASGDGDPDPGSDLTRFTFPRDANVGLLLFERVLQYASARAAAAGAARLAAAGLPEDAADAVATHGAFTSAVALFPQVDVRPHRALLLRAGVLLAWAPEPLVDPVRSSPPAPGTAGVNLRGGAPGRYYGTELDLRARLAIHARCLFDLEGALLDPGDALADAAGRAATAALVTARGTVAF